jgi:hypothetical protein
MNTNKALALLCFKLSVAVACGSDNGLIAHYSFNGNADDQSGNGNNATIDGAILTNDRFGNEKSAYSFDGSSSTIFANIVNMPAINSPISFSWWYYIEASPVFTGKKGAQNMIVVANSEMRIGVQIGFRAPDYNTLGFDVWNWGGGTLLQAKPPEPRVWHHCVYTFDGNTRRFFVDTKELGQSTTAPQEGPSSILMFGNYPKGNQYFNGKLDDIRIYNRSIDTPEIEHLFNVQR